MAGAGYKLFTAGAVLTAAQMNTFVNEQTVMVFATTAARDAALTSVKAEGNLTYQSDTNTLTTYSGTLWSTIGPVSGALTTATPTITQLGTVTNTPGNTWTTRVGRLVTFAFNLAVTSAGTASNVITVTLPVTAAINNLDTVGVGYMNDASVPIYYPCMWVINSSTTIKGVATNSGGSSTFTTAILGSSTFSAGLASGDAVAGCVTYQAAADA